MKNWGWVTIFSTRQKQFFLDHSRGGPFQFLPLTQGWVIANRPLIFHSPPSVLYDSSLRVKLCQGVLIQFFEGLYLPFFQPAIG